MLDSKESLSEKFVKRGFWLYLFTLFIGPLGYLIKMLISRDLSVEEVGIIYGVISFIVLISSYNDLGTTESLNYFLPKHIVNKEYGKAKYLFLLTVKAQLGTSLLIMAVLFFMRFWLSENYFGSDIADILSIALLFLLGINIFHSSTILFTVSQDTKLSKGAEFMRLLGTALGTGILFFSDNGSTMNYMIAWILGLTIGCLFAVIIAYRKYYKPYFLSVKSEKDISLRSTFFRYSLATLITANIGTLLSQIDMQLIIAFLDIKSVGYYSNYLSLIGLPFILISPIVGFMFPVISELAGRKENEKIRIIVKEFSLYFMIISIWVSVFFFQLGESISVLLFGEKFRTSGVILAYSAPFIFYNFMSQIAFQVLAGIGKIGERAKILLIVLVINVPLTLILIHTPLGVRGAALAVGISWIPLYFLSMKAISEFRSPIHIQSFFVNIFSALVSYSILSYIIERYNISSFSLFFIAIFTYVSIFLTANFSLIVKLQDTIKTVRKRKILPKIDTSIEP